MQPVCELSFDRTGDDTLLVRLSGSWTLGAKAPPAGSTASSAPSAIRGTVRDLVRTLPNIPVNIWPSRLDSRVNKGLKSNKNLLSSGRAALLQHNLGPHSSIFRYGGGHARDEPGLERYPTKLNQFDGGKSVFRAGAA